MRTILKGMVGLCCGALLLAATGCGTYRVHSKMLKPAQINMAGYEQITIGRIDGPPEAESAAGVMRERLQEKISATGLYQVYDRDNIAEGVQESALAEYGALFESQGSTRRFQVANALVTGRVLTHRFDDNVESNSWQDQNGTVYTNYRAVGTGQASVALKVIDLETLEVVAPAKLDASSQVATDWSPYTPPQLDPAPVMESCYAQIVDSFMKKIAPYEVPVSVELYSIGTSEQKDAAKRYFKAGDFAAARGQFEQTVEMLRADPKTKPKKLAKAVYNAAVAAEFEGDLDSAMRLIDESLSLYVHKRTLAAKARMKERLADAEKMQNAGL